MVFEPLPNAAKLEAGALRPFLLLCIKPPEVAVVRAMFTGRNRVFQPLLRYNRPAFPFPVIQDQKAETRQIF